MRTLAAFLALAGGGHLGAAEAGKGLGAPFRLNDGTLLDSARIVAIASDDVTISHAGGLVKVDVDLVPLDELAKADAAIASARKSRARDEAVQRDINKREAQGSAPRGRLFSRMALRATGGSVPSGTPENGCVVATNSSGRGTGFILRQADGYVLVSNQHVIDGGPPHRYELPGAVGLQPLTGFLAADRDIVVFDLEETNFKTYFEMEPDVDAVGLGEDVIIYGNSEGMGVRISHAKLLAKSREHVEVSVGIARGNSGGPIIRTKTGRVIAVSTFVRVRPPVRSLDDIIEHTALPKVQFYGTRIDTLATTTVFDLRRFVAEAISLDADERRMDRALTLLALMALDLGARPSQNLRDLASRADAGTRALFALSHSDFYSFSVQSEWLFGPISGGSSYIHAKKRQDLGYRRDALFDVYRDFIGRMRR